MSGRYFLDTNILVYCFDANAMEKRERANRLVRDGIERRTGVISYQVVQEFINLALRRFEPRMRAEDVQQYATVVLRPLLAVTSSMELCRQALEITERYRIGWYDSLIVAAAVEAGSEVLYSEDLQHRQRIAGIEVINPFV
jgi:predicted nucleic acid-binding protein